MLPSGYAEAVFGIDASCGPGSPPSWGRLFWAASASRPTGSHGKPRGRRTEAVLSGAVALGAASADQLDAIKHLVSTPGRRSCIGAARRINGKSVGHRQCSALIRLQSNFLRKHDVACDQVSRWNKTPADNRPAGVIDLVDIRSCAVADPIAPAAVTADNVETFRRIELRFLLGR
jgi:hypothetical protein